ncbi:MAG: hypothetical protein J7647_10810 [Cyanobacteria bacterium SBLK]|nr:hypothetical protein [Cyanobacteria bacterium SBLK]
MEGLVEVRVVSSPQQVQLLRPPHSNQKAFTATLAAFMKSLGIDRPPFASGLAGVRFPPSSTPHFQPSVQADNLEYFPR